VNMGSDSLGKSNDLGMSNVSQIHFGFRFIVNPDPIIKYALRCMKCCVGGTMASTSCGPTGELQAAVIRGAHLQAEL